MTRDEAIAKVNEGTEGIFSLEGRLVDGLVALGLLKLDTPAPTDAQLIEATVRRYTTATQGSCIVNSLRNQGLLK